MKNILLLTVICLIIAAVIIGLLWIFESITQSDALFYGARVGLVVIIVAVASAVIWAISPKNKNLKP